MMMLSIATCTLVIDLLNKGSIIVVLAIENVFFFFFFFFFLGGGGSIDYIFTFKNVTDVYIRENV